MNATSAIALSILRSLLLAAPANPLASTSETGFLDRTVLVDEVRYAYQVYVPRSYDPSMQWPVILFLHGSGERGTDGLRQTQVGLGSAIRADPDRWPVLVVFPQAPEDLTWQGVAGRVAMSALDATLQEFEADPSRVYLTGLSLGGRGTWSLGYLHPERFAALVPVCASVAGVPRHPPFLPADVDDPYAELAREVARLPIWIFHGEDDPVVPVEESRRMAAALEALGADVRYDELTEVGHDAWDPAYSNHELSAWLLRQRRP